MRNITIQVTDELAAFLASVKSRLGLHDERECILALLRDAEIQQEIEQKLSEALSSPEIELTDEDWARKKSAIVARFGRKSA